MQNTKANITTALENLNLVERRLRKLLIVLSEDNKEATNNEIKMINELLKKTLNTIENHKSKFSRDGL